jgi:hypothetical protein
LSGLLTFGFGSELKQVPAFSSEHCTVPGIYILTKGWIDKVRDNYRISVEVANGLARSIFVEDHVLDLQVLEVTANNKRQKIGLERYDSRAVQEKLVHLRPSLHRSKEAGFPLISVAIIEIRFKPQFIEHGGVRLSDVEAGLATVRLRGTIRWFDTETQKWAEEAATIDVTGGQKGEK